MLTPEISWSSVATEELKRDNLEHHRLKEVPTLIQGLKEVENIIKKKKNQRHCANASDLTFS